jgi:hypothetical protein
VPDGWTSLRAPVTPLGMSLGLAAVLLTSGIAAGAERGGVAVEQVV